MPQINTGDIKTQINQEGSNLDEQPSDEFNVVYTKKPKQSKVISKKKTKKPVKTTPPPYEEEELQE